MPLKSRSFRKKGGIGKNEIAIIVPAYNAGNFLENTLRKILGNGWPKDQVVVVDDGSSDCTPEIAAHLGVVLLKHKSNLGKGAALKTGFQYARDNGFHWCFTIDADGQHDCTYCSTFVAAAEEAEGRIDLVLGRRKLSPQNMPLDRYLSNQISSLLISLVGGVRVHDSQSGFRLVYLPALENLDLRSNRFEFESELLVSLIKRNGRIAEVGIPTIYREEHSAIKRGADTWRFIRMLMRNLVNER